MKRTKNNANVLRVRRQSNQCHVYCT